jgi:hypothetical protein
MARRTVRASQAPESAIKIGRIDTLSKPLIRDAVYNDFRDRVMSPFGRHITTATMIRP